MQECMYNARKVNAAYIYRKKKLALTFYFFLGWPEMNNINTRIIL